MAPLSSISTAPSKDDSSTEAESPVMTEIKEGPMPVTPKDGATTASKLSTSKFCTKKILIRVAIVLILVLAAALALVFALSPPGGPKQFFLHQDPPGLAAANRWETRGYGGLNLQIENALDDKYQTYFTQWISTWDNGSPDALTLETTRVSYDYDCIPTDGLLRVCSGNYGETGWRGITLSTVEGGFIINSVAKMNDFYLDSEGDTWRQYTMCHEVGHAFGLAHTDEDYYNKDRGDCLDITLKPEGDLSPGTYNFELLAELYGTVDGTVNATKMAWNSSQSGTTNYGGSGRRAIMSSSSSFSSSSSSLRGSDRPVARRLPQVYWDAVQAFHTRNLCAELNAGSHSNCAIDLGHGLVLQADLHLVL